MTEEAVLESVQTEIDLANQELNKIKIEIEEKKRELESSPAREIDEEEKRISKKQTAKQSENKAGQKIIDKQKAYDNIKVTGKFMNLRYPGQTKKLPYIKYADDPVKWHLLEHGKVYTIPRGFADQINDYYHMPRFMQKEGVMDPNQPSSQIQEVDTSNKMYAFVPVSF